MLDEELVQIVEAVWETTMGDPIVLSPGANANPIAAPLVVATIGFRGSWSGRLDVIVSAGMARRIASRMFHRPAEHCSKDDIFDAIAEMANIVGGNVKAMFPAPCQLSLPVVDDAAGGDTQANGAVCFESGGEQLLLRLAQETRPSAAAS